MEVPEEIKKKIIDLTLGTKLTASKILDLFKSDIQISIEDYYAIIEEYQQKTGEQVIRGSKRKDATLKAPDEEITALCDQRLPFNKIHNELLRKGYPISEPELRTRMKELRPTKDGKRRYVPRDPSKKRSLFDNNEIMKMYESGMTVISILKIHKDRGIKISKQAIMQRLKRSYKKLGVEMPDREQILNKLIPDEELIQYRDNGITYNEICNYYKERGINTTTKYIVSRCNLAYQNAKRRDPNLKWKDNATDRERIFKLSLEGYSEAKITEMLNKEGIVISINTVAKICKQCYEQKGMKNPKKRTSKIFISDQEIFDLCEKGLSYRKISEYTKGKGRKVSTAVLTKRCIEIYAAKGKKYPKMSHIQKGKMLKEGISDEELIKLKYRGMSYPQMRQYYAEKGLEASSTYFENRIIKLTEEGKIDISNKVINGIDLRYIDESRMKKALLNLKVTKGATDEQLMQIGKLYGVNYVQEAEKLNPYRVSKADFER